MSILRFLFSASVFHAELQESVITFKKQSLTPLQTIANSQAYANKPRHTQISSINETGATGISVHDLKENL
jgi:hypothetical protein